MKLDDQKITAKVQRWQLIKWDGEPPIDTDDPDVAQQHPACCEILEGGDDRPTITLYKRTE